MDIVLLGLVACGNHRDNPHRGCVGAGAGGCITELIVYDNFIQPVTQFSSPYNDPWTPKRCGPERSFCQGPPSR